MVSPKKLFKTPVGRALRDVKTSNQWSTLTEQKAAHTAASGRKDPGQTFDLRACCGACKERRVDNELWCQVHADCDSQPRLRPKGSPRRGTGLLLVRARRAERFRLLPLLWVPKTTMQAGMLWRRAPTGLVASVGRHQVQGTYTAGEEGSTT